MSLLEDIFLQDEANEAQELERIIEGEEFEERARSDSDNNSEKEDEAKEDKRRVEPNTAKAKRIIKNPRFVLNPARLTGPRGIQVIPEHFKDFKFKGKGHEREDLDLILKKLEHWAYRLYPKFQFEDCLKKIETLGKKRPVMVHLHKIRSDQFVSEETVVQKDSSDEDIPAVQPEEDEFDRLLQQQIELARSTPAANSVKKPPLSTHSPLENGFINIPKVTSSPSISEEQRERMLRSRRMAEEKRLARLKNVSRDSDEKISESFNNEVTHNKDAEIGDSEIGKIKRHNKSNVIDSSDDEDSAVTYVNESITVDIHSNNKEAIYSRNEESNNKNVTNPRNNIADIIQQVNKSNADGSFNDQLEVERNTVKHDISIDNIEKGNEVISKSDFNEKTHKVMREANINIEKDHEVMTEADITIEKDNEVMREADINIEKNNEVMREAGISIEKDHDIVREADTEKDNEVMTETYIKIDNIEKDHEVVKEAVYVVEEDQESSSKAQVDELMDVDFSEEF